MKSGASHSTGGTPLDTGADDQDLRPTRRPGLVRHRCPSRPAAENGHPIGASELSRRAAPTIMASPDAERVAAWIAASGDNHALPYAVIDKNSASLLLYDGRGKPVAQVPVLIGIAPGDDATPGVGSKTLGEIGPAEKTTPRAASWRSSAMPPDGRRCYGSTIPTASRSTYPGDAAKREMRRERLLSPEPDDNRITFGCINVPRAFYGSALRPLFQKKGGYVYICQTASRWKMCSRASSASTP